MDTNENNRESSVNTEQVPAEQRPAPRKQPPTGARRATSAAGAPGRPQRPVRAAQHQPAAGQQPTQQPEQVQEEAGEEEVFHQRPAGRQRPNQPRAAAAARDQRRAAAKEPAKTSSRRAAVPGKDQRRPAAKVPAKKPQKTKPTDSGYEPYREANKRKKAQRNSSIKKFFSPQNQVVAYFQNLGNKGDAFAEDSEIARQRKARREAEAAKKKRKAAQGNAPAVVYTEPIAFSRDRLLVQLLTVLAVVLAFVLGLSVFFKVKTIKVSGAEVYSPWSIREASGIKEGDNLLTFGRARASGQITAKMPYVKNVRIGIKLPDTVNIEIEEEDVVYAIKSEEGIWWLINSEGKVMEMANNSIANAHTQVLGVTLSAPKINEPAVATEEIPTETTPDGEYIPITVTGYQRLKVALEILNALEDNDIVGEAASVDVSRTEDIILWYGTQYQVNLGDSSQIAYKIACMCDVILQESDYQNGILDVSFTTWPDKVGLTPFQ